MDAVVFIFRLAVLHTPRRWAGFEPVARIISQYRKIIIDRAKIGRYSPKHGDRNQGIQNCEDLWKAAFENQAASGSIRDHAG